jgi:hypothetical protein
MLKHSFLIAILLTTVAASSTRAHDLPISEMQIVTATDTMHVELVINTSELHATSELDRNRDGHLAYAELAPHGEMIARRVFNLLTFSVAGHPLQADVCGIVPHPNTHHLTVRAHYRVDARNAVIALESRLFSIVPGAHVMQITLHRPGKRQVARLSANSSTVVFSPDREGEAPAEP